MSGPILNPVAVAAANMNHRVISEGGKEMKKYFLLSVLVALLVGCGAPAPVVDDAWAPPALADDVGELPEGR